MILSAFHLAYDGPLPTRHRASARHGDDATWQRLIACAAERQFYSLIMQSLRLIQHHRMRRPSLGARRSLMLCSAYIQNHRKKACEAYLLQQNAVYF